jgi:phosphatidate phosphatase APP1
MHKSRNLYRNVRRMVRYPAKRLKLSLKHYLGWLDEPLIMPYRSFGNDHMVRISGRVLENSGILKTKRKNRLHRNLLAMLKRYLSDTVPEMPVQVSFLGRKALAQTDQDGFFEVCIPLSKEEKAQSKPYIWQKAHIQLLDKQTRNPIYYPAEAQVLLPQSEKAQLGIISDIDDTFLLSHATKPLKKVYLLLTRHAHRRKPIEGMVDFYQALKKGHDGQKENPIFYVSNSEWNLYDLLEDFCQYQNIPQAPFLLQKKDLSWKFWQSGAGNHFHKIDKIKQILQTYPKLSFILLGDSGQKDAEVYTRIALKYPKRISAIYIRDIGNLRRRNKVRKLATYLKEKKNIDLILTPHTAQMMQHAQKAGFILNPF